MYVCVNTKHQITKIRDDIGEIIIHTAVIWRIMRKSMNNSTHVNMQYRQNVSTPQKAQTTTMYTV